MTHDTRTHGQKYSSTAVHMTHDTRTQGQKDSMAAVHMTHDTKLKDTRTAGHMTQG